MNISRILHFITRVLQILLFLYIIRLILKLIGYHVYIPILDDIFLMGWNLILGFGQTIKNLIKLPG